MQRLIFILLIGVLAGAQVMIVQTDVGERQYSYDQIRQLRFRDNGSQTNPALNIHTPAGIRQLRLAVTDSLTIVGDSLLVVYQDTLRLDFRLDEIDYLSFGPVYMPDRRAGAQTGSQFMNSVKLPVQPATREARIRSQILKGNVPDFFRRPVRLSSQFKDANNVTHTVEYDVMPDYLAVGSNEDWCRVPMTPQVAQAIADSFHCTLPTTKLVDDIWKHAVLKLDPIFYTPVGTENNEVPKFILHNREIEAQRIAMGGMPGELIAGIKKDVVICNVIKDKSDYVAIYGWHYPSGSPIQSLYTGHTADYVDYSHGIRLIGNIMKVDGVEMTVREILTDSVLFRLISNESAIMRQPYYIYSKSGDSDESN